jgi:hypothetical protein
VGRCPIADQHDQAAARQPELLSRCQAVSISTSIEPPQVRQRPGQRGGLDTLVERPHEKQYTRNSLGLAQGRGGSATGSGSSITPRLPIMAEIPH